MSNCLKCGNENPNPSNQYCSKLCRQRHCALNYYNKRKDAPEYKEKRRLYFQRWLSANREKYNLLVREKQRIRSKKLFDYRDKNNLCTRCGAARDLSLKICSKCRHKYYGVISAKEVVTDEQSRGPQ